MKRPTLAPAKLLCVTTALAMVAGFGCGQPTDEPSGVTVAPVVAATAVVNSVHLRLEAPSAARLGMDVPIILTVTNKGDQAVEFNVSDRLEFDVVVRSVDGAVVWQRSGGRPTKGVVVLSDPLNPGASRRFDARWGQRDAGGGMVPPGRYAIEGIVLAGVPLSGIHGSGEVDRVSHPPSNSEIWTTRWAADRTRCRQRDRLHVSRHAAPGLAVAFHGFPLSVRA